MLEAPLAVAGLQTASPEPPCTPLSLLAEHRLDRSAALSDPLVPFLFTGMWRMSRV